MNNIQIVQKNSILAQLVRDINGHEEAIQGVIKGIRSSANDALREAILCGDKLNSAQSLKPDEGWLIWLAANTKIHERMAQNYMRLARNTKRVSGADSIRHALSLLSGGFKPSNNETGEAKESPWWYIAQCKVGKLADQYTAGDHAFSNWPDEAREFAKEKLQPIAAQLWPEKFAS